jgi:uncharacterized protein with HEPN domain
MSRDEQDRLRDIQDAIAAIHSHLERAGETTAAKEDPLLHDALLFQFVVIGEAVKNLSPEMRESTPDIPWTDIAGLRDLIAHEYFRIDIHRVLQIVERDLPPLKQAIDRLLKNTEEDQVKQGG